MSLGLIGHKCGMTRVFDDTGVSVPVTVVHVAPNRVVDIKKYHTGRDKAFCGLQVTHGEKDASKLSRAEAGHFRKAKVAPGLSLREFKLTTEEVESYPVGTEITVELFEQGQLVDVIGTSKGKGFAGTVKRHNFSMQDATHGNSVSHRAPGSIGQNQTPGRVFKGKKMSGQMGNVQKTVQSLEIVKIDTDRHLLLIKGGVPGAPGGKLVIKPSVKAASN